MKKKKLRVVIVILLIPICIWLACLIKCEISTALHGWEFEGEYAQTNMIGGDPQPKVLRYSETEAKVYYVDECGGCILLFEKEKNKWVLAEWDAVWARGGTADGFIWPYGR